MLGKAKQLSVLNMVVRNTFLLTDHPLSKIFSI